MIILDEYRLKIQDYRKQIEELGKAMKHDTLVERLAEIEKIAAEPNFWDDMETSQKLLVEQKTIKEKLTKFKALYTLTEDAETLAEMAEDEKTEDYDEDMGETARNIEKELEKQTLETLLNGEYDGNNAILTFHAGAGGTEAQDWCLMLYRMYMRYGEQHDYKVETLDMLDGDEAGIKSASILIKGANAFGYLKSEAGVHRLVRISPFDASGRRHTSFASVEVMPEITDDKNIEIKEEDIKVEAHRASGAGGQHINKTDSAVRITHIPTGIVVGCQNERSQKQNKEQALRMLKSKLLEIKEREHLDTINDIKGDQMQIAWGSQIRSYVFMPYTLVKDHRTNFEIGNVNAVMDGDLDGFINAYLKYLKNGETV